MDIQQSDLCEVTHPSNIPTADIGSADAGRAYGAFDICRSDGIKFTLKKETMRREADSSIRRPR
jgi:hypothetical protein